MIKKRREKNEKIQAFQIFLVTLALGVVFVSPVGAQVHRYIMGTGTVGGTFYPLGAAIAKVVTDYAPWNRNNDPVHRGIHGKLQVTWNTED